jgi:aminoglycoside phosphotransferase (APT) family kinase protein
MAFDPPAAAVSWAASVVGPQARARVVRRLAGGQHAVTHLIRTERPARELVLRRFPPGDDAAAREAAALAVVDGLDGLAPRLVDADPAGRRFGEPATLITRLPGRADLTTVDPDAAAVHLGRALARIHAVPPERIAGLRDATAAAGASGPPVSADLPPVLTHYDYWSGNVLWQGNALTGVVDWSGASRAPRGFDVSWCRLDLVLLHGPAVAERFLVAYERAAGVAVPDMAPWDLFACGNSRHSVESWVPNYHDLGRRDLTAGRLRERHTAWARLRASG